MLIVGPELVDNVCQVLTRRLHSLHQPVEDVLYTGIFSVGNRNVKEGTLRVSLNHKLLAKTNFQFSDLS